MPKLPFILLLLISATCYQLPAQQIKRYYDSQRSPVEPAKAVFYSIIDQEDSLWIENSYFSNGMKYYMYGRYKDSSGKIPVDTFYYYHREGPLAQVGKYTDGKKDGWWLSYHSDGSKMDSTLYDRGAPVMRLSWHHNGQLSDSVHWEPGTEGYSVSWTAEGILDATGHYNADEKKEGEWTFYHANGKPSSIEVYQADSLKSIQTFDENGNPTPNDGILTVLEKESEYLGGQMAWIRHLSSTFRYPKAAVKRNIQGTVMIQFIIDAQGNISDIKPIKGHPILAEEALRVVEKSGKWSPAVSHGRKVKSYKKQPITFRLE